MRQLVLLLLPVTLPSAGCAAQQNDCPAVPPSFAAYVTRTLADSTGLFAHEFPPVTPLSCELLGMLEEELKDDSARYHFERFASRYWTEDPHATRTHAYIKRHLSFTLATAATAHWYADTRIEGLRELQEYRSMRPLMCTTKEGHSRLLRQDSAAVRYLIQVLETTPLGISGSENSTIHDIYIREVMETLDHFTGLHHVTTGDQRMRVDMSEPRVSQALADWRKWLSK